MLKVLVQLDKKLADRIGKDTMQELNRALSADWGEPVKEIMKRQMLDYLNQDV